MAVDAVVIHVKVVPGASRDRVAGLYGDGIKVQTTVPATRGKANEAVREIIAQFLKCDRKDVILVSAASSPRKQFRISGLSESEWEKKRAELA